jgi:thiazole tautomerase (transcriptional regulator TenI)
MELRSPLLMVVSNRHTSSRPIPDTAQAVIEGGADLFQIREKDLPEEELAGLIAQSIVRVGAGQRIVINNRLSLALRYGCGLHLPEASGENLTVVDLAPGTLKGRSIHRGFDARAVKGADYLFAGHVFPTSSKPGLEPLGASGLREIVDRVRGIGSYPVIAIGGLSLDNLEQAVAAGVSGIAVMSAIVNRDDPAKAAKEFKQHLVDAWERHNE